jgi:hypothetical protein
MLKIKRETKAGVRVGRREEAEFGEIGFPP